VSWLDNSQNKLRRYRHALLAARELAEKFERVVPRFIFAIRSRDSVEQFLEQIGRGLTTGATAAPPGRQKFGRDLL
jgi:hypothetical protein